MGWDKIFYFPTGFLFYFFFSSSFLVVSERALMFLLFYFCYESEEDFNLFYIRSKTLVLCLITCLRNLTISTELPFNRNA